MKKDLAFFKYRYMKCTKCGKTRWEADVPYDPKGQGQIL